MSFYRKYLSAIKNIFLICKRGNTQNKIYGLTHCQNVPSQAIFRLYRNRARLVTFYGKTFTRATISRNQRNPRWRFGAERRNFARGYDCLFFELFLKSQDEQDAIILQYQNYLNSLDFSVESFVQSRQLNIEPYIETLRERLTRE